MDQNIHAVPVTLNLGVQTALARHDANQKKVL